MAVNVSNEFHRTSAQPIDDSLVLTATQMLNQNDNLMPDKYFAISKTDGCLYLYDKSATPNQTTGKYTKFEGGGSVTEIKVGTTTYTPTSGVISLPAYLPLSSTGSTVWCTSSDIPVYFGGNSSTETYIGFKKDTGQTMGYIGVKEVSGTAHPYFYDGTSKEMALKSDIPTTLPASDVSAWAKASTKPSYTLDEVSDGTTRKLANYLPLSGGTMTGTLSVNNINATDSNGMLAYKPTNWTGVSSSQWGVGTINCQGVIRSSSTTDLIHYKGSTSYTIYDSSHFSVDTAASANTVAKRDANGYLRCVYINASCSTESPASYNGALAAFFSADGWLRKSSMANFATALPFATQTQKGVVKIYASGEILYINTQ